MIDTLSLHQMYGTSDAPGIAGDSRLDLSDPSGLSGMSAVPPRKSRKETGNERHPRQPSGGSPIWEALLPAFSRQAYCRHLNVSLVQARYVGGTVVQFLLGSNMSTRLPGEKAWKKKIPAG